MLQLFPDGPSKPQQNDPKSEKKWVKDPATGSLRDVLAVDRSDAIFPPEKIREMAERTKGQTHRIGGALGLLLLMATLW